jgi:hypothetical protein
MKGTINLPEIKMNDLQKELISGITNDSKLFIDNPRLINTKTSFASVSLHLKEFPKFPSFVIHGSIFHNIGCICPEIENRQFLNAFFYSGQENDRNDNQLTPEQNELCNRIIKIAKNENKIYKNLLSILEENKDTNNLPKLKIIIEDTDKRPPNTHKGTYEYPKFTGEVGVYYEELNSNIERKSRCITLSYQNDKIERIKSTHSMYDPLAYVIFHLDGNPGWTYNAIPKQNFNKKSQTWVESKGNFITNREYYAYRLHTRDLVNANIEKDLLLSANTLTQQYICDQWLKIEEGRLDYIRQNQESLKKESYQGLKDAIAANDEHNAGTFTILPSTYEGSPRHLHEQFQDGMATTRINGKADLFITMTTNVNWREITENLNERQSHKNRPDLVARVFNLKLKSLMNNIKKDGYMGKYIAHMQVIEFQKRGYIFIYIYIYIYIHNCIYIIVDLIFIFNYK